jgi:hypothetical protein
MYTRLINKWDINASPPAYGKAAVADHETHDVALSLYHIIYLAVPVSFY